MRLLTTYPHTFNGLVMKPGKREEKQLKDTQTIKNLSRTAGVVGRGGAA